MANSVNLSNLRIGVSTRSSSITFLYSSCSLSWLDKPSCLFRLAFLTGPVFLNLSTSNALIVGCEASRSYYLLTLCILENILKNWLGLVFTFKSWGELFKKSIFNKFICWATGIALRTWILYCELTTNCTYLGVWFFELNVLLRCLISFGLFFTVLFLFSSD